MSQPGFFKSSEAEREHLPPERRVWPVWPWVVLFAGLVIVMLVRAGLPKREQPRAGEHSAVGTKLSTLQLEPLTGDAREVGLDDLAGKVTLLNFWGPWCGPCIMEFPHLVELEQHLRSEKDFQLLSVASNADPLDETGLRETTQQFLVKHKAEFPTYKDPQATTTKALIQDMQMEAFGYPTTVLLGRDGAVRAVWQGYAPGDEREMRRAVEKALAEQGGI